MSNTLETDLIGLINSLSHFKGEALLPLFETIYNSIDAIEERGNVEDGNIIVRVIRQQALPGMESNRDKREIISFEIEDNGIGFNDKNYESFKTTYSTYKLEKGGKGFGRFCWLKAFERVEIDSIYMDKDSRKRRLIDFNLNVGISERERGPTDDEQKTIVRLIGFSKDYRKLDSAYKTRKKIAQRILEHCLSILIRGTAPQIIFIDGEETESINDMFQEKQEDVKTETFTKNGITLKLSHLKLYATVSKRHSLVLCANNREVKFYDFQKLLSTSMLFDKDGAKFYYSVYVSSPYLDENVDNNRMTFNIPEKKGTFLARDYPLSIEEIEEIVIEQAKEYLSEYLEDMKKQKYDIVQNYVSKKNPTLRAVPTYSPEVYDEIELNMSNERIDEILYKYKGKAEFQVRKNSSKLLKTQVESIEEIEDQYTIIIDELDALQKDQLAGYIVFRKMIIDLLSKKLELNQDGKYSNEDIIHDIILPRKATTAKLSFDDYNLWLIDERLTFHELACSDLRLCDVTSSESQDRPDIVLFHEMNEDRVARAVSIIEFKKPQRERYTEDPTQQIFRHLRKIQNGKIKLPNGRVLNVNETTKFYCYVICDTTDKIIEFAENQDYAKLMGELGYYNYNRKLNAHMEIIDYDKLVVDVQQRHKAFFEKLGI